MFVWASVNGNSLNDSNHEVLENGTLVFKTFTQADEGRYLCIAENIWGSGSAEINLYCTQSW